MSTELQAFLMDCLLAVIPILLGWSAVLLHSALAHLKKQRDPDYGFYLELLDQAVSATVKALMPRVNKLKALNEERRLKPEQIIEIQQEAKGLVLQQLSETSRHMLRKLHQDLDRAITTRMEAWVYDVKRDPKQQENERRLQK
ncbi:hypothetical protein Dred_3082 [Desulforamulus reducens MI-1]|uniref:Uncharacterized protein n=1 Tax=Desulforamulus reducens (strain ATCC BAA-1160 / DSM 100696 / MI-1) TaxID=349161 RepID=A4J931_DESRM|nr:hypothetical protein [Desulforamulus reducens]ABO51584.1 hypothetical protein Dred_3082 [Desulforamulus reducens MI-1]